MRLIVDSYPMAKKHRTAEWSEYVRRLGDNLAHWRLERDLSQEKLASVSGLSRYTYQRLEKGLIGDHDPANPTLFTLVSLAEALEIPMCTLIPEPTGQTTSSPDFWFRS